MADQSELRMNLAAIKRVDPYAKDIIDSSAHVAFYTFNSDETEWEKTDVEGAFFIYSRNAEPFHSIFINNRLNTNSLVEPITVHIELQSQPPFLLYRNERSRIRGFWFYNKSECDRIGELVEQIVKNCDQKHINANINNQNHLSQMNDMMARQTNNNHNVDIFTMLSKAQEDFNNSHHLHGSNVLSHAVAQPIKIEKQTKASDGTSQSVMNFFAAAKPATAKEVPFFQRMLSNPVHVDQIEKQQRAVSPQDSAQQQQQQQHPLQPQQHQQQQHPPFTNNSLTAENGFMRIHSPNNHELGTSPLATFLHGSNLSMPRTTAPIGIPNATDLSEIESRQQQQPLHQLLKKSAEIIHSNNTPGKPALMPPTMFKTSANAYDKPTLKTKSMPKDTASSVNTILQQHHPTEVVVASKQQQQQQQQQLHHQQQSHSQSQQHKPSQQQQQKQSQQIKQPSMANNTAKPEPLTQSQLLQAMTYLIKNDPDFVRKLHEAYLKSFTEMVSL